VTVRRGSARRVPPAERPAEPLSRRRFLELAAAGVAGLGLAACGAEGPDGDLARGRAVRYGVRYRYGPSVRQAADLLLPPGIAHRGPRLPVVALFHGGGWSPGGRRPNVWSVVRAFTQRGYAVWNVGYRVLGTGMGGGWPTTFEDAATAVDLLQDVAGRWPIDPDAVLTVGVSAGGTLATWCAGRSGLPEGAPGSSPVVVPKGTVSCAGLLDLAWNAEGGDGSEPAPPELISSAVVGLMGGTPASRPVRYELASPIDRLPFHVPSLVAQGRNDRVAVAGQARRFAVRATAEGDECELLLLDDAGHGDWDDATGAGWDAVFDALPAFVERCDLPARPRR